jgi:hypothetical protein
MDVKSLIIIIIIIITPQRCNPVGFLAGVEEGQFFPDNSLKDNCPHKIPPGRFP